MNSLRFLLVHRNPEQSDAIAALLVGANHTVLPTSGLTEAADALTVERFDAILLESEFRTCGLREFSAQLRKMEQGQRGNPRVPVIGLIHDSLRDNSEGGGAENGMDSVIPEPIDPDAITAEVIRLGQALSGSFEAAEDLIVMDPEKFREQVGFDNDLMLEIIDLFLSELIHQVPEMHRALKAHEWELLSRIAHTIKGSLSSFHAMRARASAQDLELAAKGKDEAVCGPLLTALEASLAELEPELEALRQG